jgi:hypothetical protein
VRAAGGIEWLLQMAKLDDVEARQVRVCMWTVCHERDYEWHVIVVLNVRRA